MSNEVLQKQSPNGSTPTLDEMKAALIREKAEREQAFILAVQEAVAPLSEKYRCDLRAVPQIVNGEIIAIFQASARE